MGAKISQAVKLNLDDGSTLEELLSNEKFVQTIREAVPALDEKVRKNLRNILTKVSTKGRSSSDPRQAAAAGTNDATSGVSLGVTTASSTTLSGAATALSTTSNVASPTVSVLLGEKASPIAASRENDRTQPLWEVKEHEVALPSEIADSFERWKADPLVFLQSDSSQAPTSLTEHYNYALSVRTSAAANTILWRFITTAYHDAISARSRSDRYSITKEAVAFAVAVICNSSSYDREVVEANLINWARDGAKNRAFADKLGSTSCYFYYPQHLSEWLWIKHLPLGAYDKAAKLLNKFGILEKAQKSGAVDLARSIETILKAPFQSTVPIRSQGEWILPVSLQQSIDSAGGAAPHEHTSGLQKRKLKPKTSPKKQQRLEAGIAQRPCKDLFAEPVRDTRSSSFQSDSFAATPSTTSTQSIGSNTSIIEKQQPAALNHIDDGAMEQHAANAQDPNQLCTIQPEPNPPDQELLMGPQLRQRDQQQREFTSNVITQLFLPVLDPTFQLQLSVQRKVSDTAESIRFAMKGDTGALKRLFSEGLASPVEVSNSRELSLLGWALYAGMWNYRTAQFLVMECNALIDDWSYEHAWEYAYRNSCNITELQGLACIMMNASIYRDWIGEQNFAEVHEIILGRSSKLLVTELNDNPSAVCATDAKGRTALAWATARAQLDDMELLIARGSDVDAMDTSGRSILLNAVDSSNNEGLRILLEAGANPNPVVPEGLFRSSPLIAASTGSKLEMIKSLIEFGAETCATNPEGWTALQAATKAQTVDCAKVLVSRGADLGYISKNGHSALTTAIVYNSHAVLELLIDWYHVSHLNGLQLLPIIAKSADADTMSILGASALKQTLLSGCEFATSYEILRSRTDYDEGLGNAFNEFLTIAGPRRK